MRPNALQTLTATLLVFTATVSNAWALSKDWDARPNILLVMVDDLRATGETYDTTLPFLKVPNMDEFAKDSLVFTSAHVQSPLCGPSRASIFTSRRPDEMKRWQHKYQGDWSSVLRKSDDMFQTMTKNGYYVYGTGKLYHWFGWTRSIFNYSPRYFKTDFLLSRFKCNPNKLHCPVRTRFPQQTFTDVKAVKWARRRIHALERRRWIRSKYRSLHRYHRPWFMAVGLYRPHRPYKLPKSYFDSFPINSMPAPSPNTADASIPREAKFACDYRHFDDMKIQMDDATLPVPDQVAQYIRQGYAAAAKYADNLVGYLLRKLNYLKAKDNTVVIITSDHGYALGEGGNYCKVTSFESSTRVPLMIRDPRYPSTFGTRTNATVELLGLFPTIMDIAGEKPGNKVPLPSLAVGKSFQHVVRGEDHAETENYAYSETPRCFDSKYVSVDCSPRRYSTKIDAMMYSVRSSQWRYTETWKWNKSSGKEAKWNDPSGLLSRELYDHRFSNGYNNTESEYINIMDSGDFVASLHQPIVDHLRAQLESVYKP